MSYGDHPDHLDGFLILLGVLAAIGFLTLFVWFAFRNSDQINARNNKTRMARIASCQHFEVPSDKILCLDRTDR